MGVPRLDVEDVCHGVGAEPDADRLEGDHVGGRDVAEVHVAAEVLHEPGLLLLLRRLEEELRRVHLRHQLLDEAGLHLAVRVVDADRPALPRLADDTPAAGGQVRLGLLDPAIRRHDARRVLRPDLGEDDEVARQRPAV